jgi:ribosomal protein S27AE
MSFPYILHDDETLREDLKWCPNCGDNATIITWESRIGTRYRCSCGLQGRFGDGTSEPLKEQPIE